MQIKAQVDRFLNEVNNLLYLCLNRPICIKISQNHDFRTTFFSFSHLFSVFIRRSSTQPSVFWGFVFISLGRCLWDVFEGSVGHSLGTVPIQNLHLTKYSSNDLTCSCSIHFIEATLGADLWAVGVCMHHTSNSGSSGEFEPGTAINCYDFHPIIVIVTTFQK